MPDLVPASELLARVVPAVRRRRKASDFHRLRAARELPQELVAAAQAIGGAGCFFRRKDDGLDYPGWVATYNRVRRHVTRDDAAGGNDTSITYANTF